MNPTTAPTSVYTGNPRFDRAQVPDKERVLCQCWCGRTNVLIDVSQIGSTTNSCGINNCQPPK